MANAPEYKGTSQPVRSQRTDLLGWLGNLIGRGGELAYQGTGQPAPRSAGAFAIAAPAYQQAPEAQPTACVNVQGTAEAVHVAGASPTACGPLPQGPIAILVPCKG
jgi:hypothetical protein